MNILFLADYFSLKMYVLLRLDKFNLHSTNCLWWKQSSVPYLSDYKCPWFGSSCIKEWSSFVTSWTGTDFWNVLKTLQRAKFNVIALVELHCLQLACYSMKTHRCQDHNFSCSTSYYKSEERRFELCFSQFLHHRIWWIPQTYKKGWKEGTRLWDLILIWQCLWTSYLLKCNAKRI